VQHEQLCFILHLLYHLYFYLILSLNSPFLLFLMTFQNHFIQSFQVFSEVFLFFHFLFFPLLVFFPSLPILFSIFLIITISIYLLSFNYLYSSNQFKYHLHFATFFAQKFSLQASSQPCLKYHLYLYLFYHWLLIHQLPLFLLTRSQVILFPHETIFSRYSFHALQTMPSIPYRILPCVSFMLQAISQWNRPFPSVPFLWHLFPYFFPFQLFIFLLNLFFFKLPTTLFFIFLILLWFFAVLIQPLTF
jgi:hypothetical protein